MDFGSRMYDDFLGRWFTQDPLAEDYMPLSPYAYCANNPVMYRDYNGERFGLDDLIVAAAGFVFNYVSHGISTGHWGASALQAGAMGAIGAWVGFNTFGVGMSAGNYIGNMAINTAASHILPTMNIQIGNLNISAGMGFGFGSGGFTAGFNIGASYRIGDWTLSGGYGMTSNDYSFSGGVNYYDRKNGQAFGFYLTDYRGTDPQTVGGVSYSNGDFSLRLENDMFAFNSKDRWRTAAFEVGIGNYVIGGSIYTNDGEIDSEGIYDTKKEAPLWGKNSRSDKYGAWKNGQVYSSHVWIGYRSGTNIIRAGYSFKGAQNFLQNGVHKYISGGRQNYYLNYDNFYTGPCGYFGYYNPFSLF
jgi:hypothetical protein